MSTSLSEFVTPTASQYQETKKAIDAYIQSLNHYPTRRVGSTPYYLFHEPDKPIRGTILVFHGFSAKPYQTWRLADYLFHNQFNVYQCSLAGHVFTPPEKYWPQVKLKPEFCQLVQEKVKRDPILQHYRANIAAKFNPILYSNGLHRHALMERLFSLEPRLTEIAFALNRENEADFHRYFTANIQDYLIDAQTRLTELAAMPGPIYAIGASVGGTVALALAADHPLRIKRVVAYGPLLKILGEERHQYLHLAAPLAIPAVGWYQDIGFPVGALAAAARLGQFLLSGEIRQKLRKVPTFFTFTENDDLADLKTNQEFFEMIGGNWKGHRSYVYQAGDLVPHSMVNPTEMSQGMSNYFWANLYQETFRFLTKGEISVKNMNCLTQDSTLPLVSNV